MIQFGQKSILDLEFKTAIKNPIPIKCAQINEPFQVETLEGNMKGKPGDWLMIGVMGEKYVCDQFIFSKTYQLIN